MTYHKPGKLDIGMRTAVLLGASFLASATIMVSEADAADACPTGPALTPGTQTCSSNKTGTIGSFGWSIWSSGSGGCITPSGNTAAFKATWSNSGDFLARMGFQWNETKTFDAYGTVTADYAYTKTGTGGGYSYMGIYGWSNGPLVEFYIVDDWYGSGSAPTAGGALKDTFTVDDGKYKVYTHTQVNQPSIHGNTTFLQIFSIRQTARQCGHISVSEHWKKWKALGLELGKMYEAKLLVEVGGGTGSIEYSVGTMSSGTATAIPPPRRAEPEVSRTGAITWADGRSGKLSLLSLDGSVLGSVRKDASHPGTLMAGGLPKGLYVLRFQGERGAPESSKLLLP
jgi:hypothetical protein